MAKQAETVQHTFEKQVLNNLAMYRVKPDGIPYLMLPTEGATNVDGNAKITGAAPLNPFFETIGLESGRTSGNSWTLSPVVDADKLNKIRDIFKSYANCSDWLVCSNRRADVPRCCTEYGEFCGNFVWVAPGSETQFTDLVLEIIKAATVEDAEVTKVATVYIDSAGKPTTAINSVGSIVAEIELAADPIKSLTSDTYNTNANPTFEVKRAPTPFSSPGILQFEQRRRTLRGSSSRTP